MADVDPLWGEFGVVTDWSPPRRAWTTDERSWLQGLLAMHRAVLFRDVDPSVRAQLELTAAIGAPVGVRPRWHGRGVIPQVRLERHDPAPHNDVWHADGSWSTHPAAATVIFCGEAAETAAGTELADTAAGFERLPADRQVELRARSAFHHVEQAESLRFGVRGPGEPATVGSSRAMAAVAFRWESWRSQRRQGRAIVARRPTDPGLPGAVHPVVGTAGGRDHVYLGAHAWRLDDEVGSDSLDRIDQWMDEITGTSVVHRWSAGDLLVFDNRSLLHRREPDLLGPRLLRRTLASAPME